MNNNINLTNLNYVSLAGGILWDFSMKNSPQEKGDCECGYAPDVRGVKIAKPLSLSLSLYIYIYKYIYICIYILYIYNDHRALSFRQMSYTSVCIWFDCIIIFILQSMEMKNASLRKPFYWRRGHKAYIEPRFLVNDIIVHTPFICQPCANNRRKWDFHIYKVGPY